MSEKTHRRTRWLVDPKVQGNLLLQVVVYWIACLIGIAMMILCWRIST
jgi:hypothetical protein